MENYQKPTTNSFLFSSQGRITRGEWWALQFIGIALFFITLFFHAHLTAAGNNLPAGPHLIGLLVVICMNFMVIWIQLTATTKRFHDRGKSGSNCLWQLLPIIGTFYVLYACGITENGRVQNAYGAPRI